MLQVTGINAILACNDFAETNAAVVEKLWIAIGCGGNDVEVGCNLIVDVF